MTSHATRNALRFSVLALVGVLGLPVAACGSKQTTDTPQQTGDPDYPTNYRQWSKVNASPIIREDEGVARELYTNPRADLGVDTVLVKEQYRLEGGEKGALEFVAVMRRTGRGEAGGWSFQAFDPTTRQQLTRDSTACVGCHTLQADADYLFSEPSALQQ
ncbi:MAG: cytochrome P460 family protein [Myxococcota bacterium]